MGLGTMTQKRVLTPATGTNSNICLYNQYSVGADIQETRQQASRRWTDLQRPLRPRRPPPRALTPKPPALGAPGGGGSPGPNLCRGPGLLRARSVSALVEGVPRMEGRGLECVCRCPGVKEAEGRVPGAGGGGGSGWHTAIWEPGGCRPTPRRRCPLRSQRGRWGRRGGAGKRARDGAGLRARPRQSQVPPGGARARKGREAEGRAGCRAQPIGTPRRHDVRLSGAQSASRQAGPVSTRARGCAGAPGGTSAEPRKRELCVLIRTGRSVGAPESRG